MDRTQSVLSEEIYDLVGSLDYPRPRTARSRPYGRPEVHSVQDSKFPGIPSTHVAAGSQLTRHMQRGKDMLDTGVDAEIRNRKQSDLVPIFDIKNKEDTIHTAKIAAINADEMTPSTTIPWKEERELRIKNAMTRVQQSYVSNVKTLHSTNASKEGDSQPHYSPNNLDPVKTKNQAIWDEDRFRRSRVASDRIQKEYVDELRTDPIVNQARRSSQQEIEIDRKRADMVSKRMMSESQRTLRNAKTHAAYEAEYERKKIMEEMRATHAPQAPVPKSRANAEDGYSRRKRKVKAVDPCKVRVADVVPAPPATAAGPGGYRRAVPQAISMQHEITGWNASHAKYENDPIAEIRNDSCKNNAADTKQALIPRQMAHNIRSWNSDTAKRGLGFKSKLRRNSEEGSVTESMSENISPEVRQKWKKATLY